MKIGEYPNLAKPKGELKHPSVSGSGRGLLRLWVVDDNTMLSDLFAKMLNKQPGIRCARQFCSAEALLAVLKEERPPDMILLDINLGGKSGLASIRPIKKLAPKVKVLMLTMFSNSHYEEEAFREGASGFLLKSYDRDELVNLIYEAQRCPGSDSLFPNMALRREARLGLGAAGTADGGKRFSLAGTLRQLLRNRRRQKAN